MDTDPQVDTRTLNEQILTHQMRAAAQWETTADDLLRNDHVRARDAAEQTRRSIVVVSVLAVLLFVAGMIWTAQNVRHDRFIDQERAAAAPLPYRSFDDR